MFRLIRLSIFILLAFGAGILFERRHQSDLCESSGGTWLRSGLCVVEDASHG